MRPSILVLDSSEDAVEAFDVPLWRRMYRSMSAQLSDIFFDNLPHEYVKLLEPQLSIRWGAFLYSCIFVLAAVIFAYLYQSTSSTVYLSPTYASNCVKVDRPVTQSFLASVDGHWMGTRAYEPSRALYSFAFSNFSSTTTVTREGSTTAINTLGEQYQSLMYLVGRVVEDTLGPIFKRQNLAENVLYLLLWSLPTFTGATSNQQTFSFTGSPLAVMKNMQYSATGLSSETGACSATSSTTFDAGSQQWTISWDAEAFLADRNCTDALPLGAVGYVVPSSHITLKVDVRSYFSAIAANYPAPSFGDGAQTLYAYQTEGLRRVAFVYTMGRNGSSVSGHGALVPIGNPPQNYTLDQYYDDGYPGMSTIYCIQRADDDGNPIPSSRKICFLKLNAGLFAYPLWNHFGQTSGIFDPDVTPAACHCSDPSAFKDGSNCRNFDFLSSFVFFKGDVSRPTSLKESAGLYWAMSEFLQQPNVQGNSISDKGYRAAWYTAPHLLMSLAGFNEGSTVDSDLSATYYRVPMEPALRREVFSFCNTSHGGCSMLSLRSANNGQNLANSWAVSSDYFQFISGNCQFSLFNRTTWQALVDTPPTSFEQDYFKCFPYPSQAFVTASGLALANTKALAPLLVLLLVNLLFAFQWFTGSSYPRAYSREEKDTVLGLLAKRVLLASRPAATNDKDRGGGDVIPASQTPTLTALMTELGVPDAPLEVYIARETVHSAPLQRLKACVGAREVASPPDSATTGSVPGARFGSTVSPMTLANNDARLPAPRGRVSAKSVDRTSTDSQL